MYLHKYADYLVSNPPHTLCVILCVFLFFAFDSLYTVPADTILRISIIYITYSRLLRQDIDTIFYVPGTAAVVHVFELHEGVLFCSCPCIGIVTYLLYMM